MKWGPYHDMQYMLLMTAHYGDEDLSNSEIEEMASSFVNQLFQADLDGDGVVDSALPEDHTVTADVFDKYGDMMGDYDAQKAQFASSANAVAKHFQYNHNRMQGFVNDMVNIASADGHVDEIEEDLINYTADCWGCTANISYQGGMPIIVFVW